MSKEEAIKVVGPKSVIEESGDILVLAAPAGTSFASYVLYITPEKGLLKLIGVTNDIQTDNQGGKFQSEFYQIVSRLVSSYGSPTGKINNLRSRSPLKAPRHWMSSVARKDRIFLTYWDGKELMQDGVVFVSAKAIGLSANSGYVQVIYEFNGWHEYLAMQKNTVRVAGF